MSAPIRIALDASCALESPMTGVGYAAWHLLRALARQSQGWDLRLFGTPDHQSAHALDELRPAFSRWTILPKARQLKYGLWPAVNWPPIEWFCGEVDIAHNLFHQLPAARCARRVATIHDLSFLRMPQVHTAQNVRKQTRLVRHCARCADALIAVSQHCKAELIELLGVAEERIHVVPNGVDTAEFEGDLDRSALDAVKQSVGLRREYFIHLGTLEPRKNIPRLLRAYAALRGRVRDCPQLLLVGKKGWLYEPVFDAMATLGLSDAVIHVGHLPRPEAILLLRGAVACVYPSLYEGFGLPVLEAMAARVPVVTSNTSALPEVVGDTAVLVDPLSEEALAEALGKVLTERDAALAKAEAAYARAQTFTWERSAQALVQAYRRIKGETI